MKKRFFVAILVAIFAYMGYVGLSKNQLVRATNTRVVTVHVDGQDKVIATNAKTVGQVLKKLDKPVSSFDKTEPSADAELTGVEFKINVYRARLVAVVDGSNSYTVMTAERTPRKIATEAGFKTSPEDQFGFSRADDPFEQTPGTEMIIKRAKTINFDLYGTTSSVETHESTVAEFLTSRGIDLGKGDELSVPKESRISEGMTISLAQVERNFETVEEVASFQEQQIKDAQQPTTYKKVQTPGVDGKKLVTYEIVTKNGGEPQRNPVKEVITIQPVTQVVVVGARTGLPYTGGGNKTEWMIAAGISEADYGYVDFIIGRESGWNPNSVNRSSGACGLAQAYPCSKVPGNPLNPVDSLKWVNGYVNRYGGWAGTYAHWQQYHSY